MRPRRVVHLCCASPNLRSELCFFLQTAGYNIAAAREGIPPECEPDLVLVVDGRYEIGEAKRLAQLYPLRPMVVLMRGAALHGEYPSSFALPCTTTNAQLLEVISALAKRKRGPKKGSHRKKVSLAVPA